MQGKWIYRRLKTGFTEVSSLIEGIFRKSIAPLFEPEGVDFFLEYIRPENLLSRQQNGHVAYAAFDHSGGRMVGFIEGRYPLHLSLLFVDETCRQQGIANSLLSHLIRHFWDKDIHLKEITVHSSPNSVEIYKAMGFIPQGKEMIENGIRYTPMKKNLTR